MHLQNLFRLHQTPLPFLLRLSEGHEKVLLPRFLLICGALSLLILSLLLLRGLTLVLGAACPRFLE